MQHRTFRRKRPGMNGRSSLLDVMLRDGILYFSVVCGVNLMNVIVYFVSVPLDCTTEWS